MMSLLIYSFSVLLIIHSCSFTIDMINQNQLVLFIAIILNSLKNSMVLNLDDLFSVNEGILAYQSFV